VSYDLQTVRAPRLAGFALNAMASLLENPVTAALIRPKLLKDTGIEAFRRANLFEPPSVVPTLPRAGKLADAVEASVDLPALVASAPKGRGFSFETISDFGRAYREGRTTPEVVAGRLSAALNRSDAQAPALRSIVAFLEEDLLSQARASTERFRRNAPLGPLDGVPVAVKDELDTVPFPTTVGTRFLRAVAKEDATVAARLRAAGALLIGKANMHEIGIDTSGFNQHHGTPRNPYDPGRYTGGSSSGSAAAVAAGLCPLSVGADGGGSIRIPASLCGLVGLKATWGRVSESGAAPLCWSVAHIGPMAATVRDAALGYAVMAGPDPRDPNTAFQPPVHLKGLGDTKLEGLRLGVFTPWFEHASPEVVASCRSAIEGLVARGARVVEVALPDLELCRVAHAVTILSEMATALDPYEPSHREEYSFGVRINLALARVLTNRDYVRAQQVRTRITAHLSRALTEADVLLTPSTAITAPVIADDVLPFGESNLDVTSALMRFAFPANLTGYPALSVPVGYDANHLPIGMQVLGRPWEEHLLLRIAESVEMAVERRRPKVHFSLLGDV
jgi:Asp-tRNA(Asn)/Glu-tRNA(Gln) amidotransferase A subunit family amidase